MGVTQSTRRVLPPVNPPLFAPSPGRRTTDDQHERQGQRHERVNSHLSGRHNDRRRKGMTETRLLRGFYWSAREGEHPVNDTTGDPSERTKDIRDTETV